MGRPAGGELPTGTSGERAEEDQDMTRPHCIILGGGFGGVAAAHRLRERMGERIEVTLVDRRGTFMMGLRILWTLAGHADRAGGTRSLDTLARAGIRYLRDDVVEIDPKRMRVTLKGGTLSGDALVVALGAELRPDLIPGYDPEASNLYDPDQVERLAARLASLDRGRIGIGILGAPYKCPPAPYEAAFLIDALLRQRGSRSRLDLEVFTPMPSSLPVAGPQMCMMVEGLLAARGIGFLPARKVTAVEGREVVFQNDRRVYDLLIGIPPHRAPAVIKTGGLTVGEWIRPDRRTCEIPEWFNVFAVGDVTEMALLNGMMLPKAGIFAESQGRVAADEIAGRFAGPDRTADFDGHGYCFVETGDGMAAAVRGDFFASPEPAIAAAAPNPQTLAEKREFEASRLSAWF
jgi:sulfide:quinone oxidoreductase